MIKIILNRVNKTIAHRWMTAGSSQRKFTQIWDTMYPQKILRRATDNDRFFRSQRDGTVENRCVRANPVLRNIISSRGKSQHSHHAWNSNERRCRSTRHTTAGDSTSLESVPSRVSQLLASQTRRVSTTRRPARNVEIRSVRNVEVSRAIVILKKRRNRKKERIKARGTTWHDDKRKVRA